MKFMITWKLHPGKFNDALAHFSQMTPKQDQADRGSSIKQIGRWHDPVGGTGVVICETSSTEALSNWIMNWNSIMDFDIAPVLDDNEARALGKKRAKKS